MTNVLPLRSGDATFGVPLPRAVDSLLWFRPQDACVIALIGFFMARHPSLGADRGTGHYCRRSMGRPVRNARHSRGSVCFSKGSEVRDRTPDRSGVRLASPVIAEPGTQVPSVHTITELEVSSPVSKPPGVAKACRSAEPHLIEGADTRGGCA